MYRDNSNVKSSLLRAIWALRRFTFYTFMIIIRLLLIALLDSTISVKKSLWRLLDCPFARWFISHAGYELQEHRSSRKLAAQTKGRWEGVKCRRSDLFNIEDLDNIFTYEAHTTTVNPFFKDWALFPDGLGRRREVFLLSCGQPTQRYSVVSQQYPRPSVFQALLLFHITHFLRFGLF